MLCLLGDVELDPSIFYEHLEYPSRGLKASHSSLEAKLRGNSSRTEGCKHCGTKFVDFSLLGKIFNISDANYVFRRLWY